ncbi:MAG: IclR family transcriptional regulator [Thermodesulfobacteriota bacterium]
MPGKYRIKSLEKIITILSCIYDCKNCANLNEITKKTGINKTTCFRLLQAMMAMNIVIQRQEHKVYSLGPQLISWGLFALSELDFHKEALPLMKILQTDTGESVNLSILDGTDVVIIERFRSNHLYSLNVNNGTRLPVYCTSHGKIILSYLPESKLEVILKKIQFIPLTNRTIINVDSFRKELKKTKKRGYAINMEEFEKGMAAVAGPVLNHKGEVIASLNVSYATARHSELQYNSNLAKKVLIACKKLSHSLGRIE